MVDLCGGAARHAHRVGARRRLPRGVRDGLRQPGAARQPQEGRERPGPRRVGGDRPGGCQPGPVLWRRGLRDLQHQGQAGSPGAELRPRPGPHLLQQGRQLRPGHHGGDRWRGRRRGAQLPVRAAAQGHLGLHGPLRPPRRHHQDRHGGEPRPGHGALWPLRHLHQPRPAAAHRVPRQPHAGGAGREHPHHPGARRPSHPPHHPLLHHRHGHGHAPDAERSTQGKAGVGAQPRRQGECKCPPSCPGGYSVS